MGEKNTPYSPSRRARRSVAAAVAGVALPFLVAGWSVSAAGLPPLVPAPAPTAGTQLVPAPVPTAATQLLPAPAPTAPTQLLPAATPPAVSQPVDAAAHAVGQQLPPALAPAAHPQPVLADLPIPPPPSLPAVAPLPSLPPAPVVSPPPPPPAPAPAPPPVGCIPALTCPVPPVAPGTLPNPAGPGAPGSPGTLGNSATTPANGPSPAASSGAAVPGTAPAAATPGGTGGPPAVPNAQSSVLGALLGLLGTPPSVGIERPTLRHFGVLASDQTAVLSQPGTDMSSATGPNPSRPSLLLIAAATALLAAAGIAMRSQLLRAPRFRRFKYGPVPAALGAVAIIAAATSGATGHGGPAGASRAAIPASASLSTRSATTLAHRMPTVGEALLAKLTTLENTIAFQVARVQVFTTAAQKASVAPTAPLGGSSTDLQRQTRSAAQALEATLQQEYDFFATTARDQAQATALIEASSTRAAAIRDAVAYDVQSVQVQQSQQTAITRVGLVNVASGTAPTHLTTPLDGVLTQGFGASPLAFEPALTFGGVTYSHFHTGLDIAAPLDTPVHAAADGVVALAASETDVLGHLVGYGNFVVITHGGGMVTLYGHLDQLLVHPGQPVNSGDAIGLEGSSGNSTGPHLHFEVRVGGLLADPMKYLAAH